MSIIRSIKAKIAGDTVNEEDTSAGGQTDAIADGAFEGTDDRFGGAVYDDVFDLDGNLVEPVDIGTLLGKQADGQTG